MMIGESLISEESMEMESRKLNDTLLETLYEGLFAVVNFTFPKKMEVETFLRKHIALIFEKKDITLLKAWIKNLEVKALIVRGEISNNFCFGIFCEKLFEGHFGFKEMIG